jgi:hypothetical protein
VLLEYLLAFPLLSAGPVQTQDACAPMLPKDLQLLVARRIPGYRLPKQSDNLPEDIGFHVAHGGNGCLGIATGDFNGDRQKDFAFLVTSDKDVWLVVAFRQTDGWRVDKVWQAGEASDRTHLYVDVAPPGKYDDIGLAEKPEPGQVNTFTSKADVVVTGATESTAIAFWKGRKGWVHVWLSD